MIFWEELEDGLLQGSACLVLFYFVRCLPALNTELERPLSNFLSFIAKIVVDCAEALYVRKLGRWYSVLQLLLTRR